MTRASEEVLTEISDSIVLRQDIVEIGNLASCGNGAAAYLMSELMAYLSRQGIVYALATATHRLRRCLSLWGSTFQVLAPAFASALPDQGRSWGSYYLNDPWVITGVIPPTTECATRRLQLPCPVSKARTATT